MVLRADESLFIDEDDFGPDAFLVFEVTKFDTSSYNMLRKTTSGLSSKWSEPTTKKPIILNSRIEKCPGQESRIPSNVRCVINVIASATCTLERDACDLF
jgi:hypothetical protein